MGLVIGLAFTQYGPMTVCKVTCEHAIGALRHPCDEVHRAPQPAAAPPEKGVVGPDGSLIALRTDGIRAPSSDCFETLSLAVSPCHVLRYRGGQLVEVEMETRRKVGVIATGIDK